MADHHHQGNCVNVLISDNNVWIEKNKFFINQNVKLYSQYNKMFLYEHNINIEPFEHNCRWIDEKELLSRPKKKQEEL